MIHLTDSTRTPVCLLCLLVLGGCSHFKQLRLDIDAMQKDLDTLKTQLQETNAKIGQQYELVRLARADQQVGFNEMEKNMAALAGNLTESQDRLSRIDEKTQELKRGWEEKARADSVAAVARLAEVEGLFEVAMSDFQSGKHSVALGGFQDITKRFPDSPRALEAVYWSAECCFALRQLDDAEKAFSDYVRHSSEGTHVCGALFKLGLVYDRMKKPKSRDLVWGKVTERCAGTDEAKAVESRQKGR